MYSLYKAKKRINFKREKEVQEIYVFPFRI